MHMSVCAVVYRYDHDVPLHGVCVCVCADVCVCVCAWVCVVSGMCACVPRVVYSPAKVIQLCR